MLYNVCPDRVQDRPTAGEVERQLEEMTQVRTMIVVLCTKLSNSALWSTTRYIFHKYLILVPFGGTH